MIVWKKAKIPADRTNEARKCILKLELTKGTKVYSRKTGHIVYNGRQKLPAGKIRANKLKVLDIQYCRVPKSLGVSKAFGLWNIVYFWYKKRQIVRPKKAFSMEYEVCASGIHFFVSRRSAERW